jgi:hypothetical protein
MMKIHLFALLLALSLAVPAFADDWDGISDAIGSRTSDDAAVDAGDDSADPDETRDRDEDASAGSSNDSKSIDLDQKATAQKPREADPNGFSAGKDSEGKRNVLGPLWGVPSGSPVMQSIDPEMEKQYAVNGEGRLAPQPDAEDLEEQQREAQRAERQRQREAERSAKEQRWAQEEAERNAEKDADRQARAQTDLQQPRTDDVEQEGKQDDPRSEASTDSGTDDEVDERRTLSIGCRSEDED